VTTTIPPFDRVPTDDQGLSELQDRLERTLRPVAGCAIVDGRRVPDTGTEAIDTAAAGTKLTHGLGRTPAGFVVVDSDADAAVWRVAQDANSITLRAGAAVNAAVWVF